MVRIDDLIILGRAVPILLKDSRKTICTAGYSEKRGFVRIYPTSYKDPLRNWDVVSIEVREDRRDSREESWQRVPSERFSTIRTLADNRAEKEHLLESISEEICTTDLNEQRRSLAIIKPQKLKTQFIEAEQDNEGKAISNSLAGFFNTIPDIKGPRIKSEFKFLPYLEYRCGSQCKTQKPHKQQLIEWGVYRWMEKHPDNIEGAWANLHINDDDWYRYLFIGNLRDQRTSWLIISVLRGKKNINLPAVNKNLARFKKKPEKGFQAELDFGKTKKER